MRSNTMVWMGVRHFGDSTWKVEPKQVPAGEVPREFARVMIQVSLAKRLELVIARSEAEIIARLTERTSASGANRSTQSTGFDFDMAELEREMAALQNTGED